MDFDVQEILAKRKANIDKLNNYLDAGKTPDEKIVKKTLQNIRRAEGQLIAIGFTDFDAINDDGTFTKAKTDIPQNENNTTTTSSNEASTEEEIKYSINNVHSISASDDNEITNSSKDNDIIESSNTELVNESNHNSSQEQYYDYNKSINESNDSDNNISHELKYDNKSINTQNDSLVDVHDDHNNNSSNPYDNSSNSSAKNDESSIDTLDQNESASVNSTNVEADQNNNEHKSKKKLFKIKKNRTEKLGVSIKKSNISNVTKLAKDSGRTPNNVVNFMLESIYDEAHENFNVEFAKKEEIKNTSYLIDERYSRAIEKIAKRTNLSKSDIFNILLETALKDYI